jgi:hypothetical protein
LRGWIAQQLMKSAASLNAESDVVAHLDSDSAVVRPLALSHFHHDGRTRLYAGPVAERHAGHAVWYAEAGQLLGLPAGDYYRAEYIAPLVVWRRSVVSAMTARIEATTGRPWARALAGTPHFSEYVLYGMFAEYGLGLEVAGLRKAASSYCLTRWVDGFDEPAEIAQFLALAEADQLVCCLQSTLAIPLKTRARIFREVGETIAALQAAGREAAA